MFRPTLARAFQSTARRSADAGKGNPDVLRKGAKRDPELYILLGVMSGAFGLAGWYFGRKPTSAVSEASVTVAEGSMPWEVEGEGNGEYKYKYHPGGDRRNAPKGAPSALHATIIPSITLPKSTHEKVNKWGRDDY